MTPAILEMYEEWPRTSLKPYLKTGYDREAGTVRISPGGIWSVDDVTRFDAIQRRINDAARRGRHGAKILMDLRDAMVVSQAVSEGMRNSASNLYRAEDRIAILVNSSLLRLQLRRAFTIGEIEIFTSAGEAEEWLQAL